MKYTNLDCACKRHNRVNIVCKRFIPCRRLHICNSPLNCLRSLRLLPVYFDNHIRIYPFKVYTVQLSTGKGQVKVAWLKFTGDFRGFQRDKLNIEQTSAYWFILKLEELLCLSFIPVRELREWYSRGLSHHII